LKPCLKIDGEGRGPLSNKGEKHKWASDTKKKPRLDWGAR